MHERMTWLEYLRRLIAFAAPNVGSIFELPDMYAHEAALARKFPDNRNIRANIRDVLQELRDLGELQFLGHGVYRRMA